jgi:hypothetical protein
VTEPARECEDVQLPFRAELLERHVEGAFEVGEVGRDVVPAEQGMGQRPPADEHLVGHLAAQHPPIRHPFRRVGFVERVERRDADRREREQVAIVAAVDDERVTESFARRCERRDRIGARNVPRHPDALRDRGLRRDGWTVHDGSSWPTRLRPANAAAYP